MEGLSEQVKAPTAEGVFVGGGDMGALMRSMDWSKTRLGPVENWPQSLRTAVSICLASHFPMLIWWGPEFVKLYNDAYRPMLGATKHPMAMGQPGRECWPEIWDIIGPMLEGVLREGKATWSERSPEDRWRAYTYEEIVARDKCSLDIFWLKDESLEDSSKLPAPDVLAAEIAEDLRSALEQIESVLGDLQNRSAAVGRQEP